MEINPIEFTVGQIAEGFEDLDDEGVTGLNGRLNIRPRYQREFVYDDEKRNKVMDTIFKGFPLNVMYWMDLGDGRYEVLDGQQRTISFCRYVSNMFSINDRTFANLKEPEKKRILNYKLMVYVCKGDDEERLNWFRTINIAGKPLNEQEIRNAVYEGEWVTAAKKYFSKTKAPAIQYERYMSGKRAEQAYLESALKWISDAEGKSITKYMSEHQGDTHATPLWNYYVAVMTWVASTFPDYYANMKNVEWGLLYNRFRDKDIDPKEASEKVKALMKDDEVRRKSGIYEYILSGDEKCLNLREFTPSERETLYARQDGVCPMCEKEGAPKVRYEITEMDADHIVPWKSGGKTVLENGRMLCQRHNRSNRTLFI